MNAFNRLTKNCLIATVVVALMTVATAQARAEGKPADLHYLAVGVSKVPHLPPQSQLRFAHKDAQDLANVWQAQQGPLYKNVRGEVLTNENATLADILAGLDRLDANTKTGDTAVVSFAGHGAVAGQRITQWFYVPSDFNPACIDQTALYECTLRDRLTKLTERGVTVILVLDTCHSAAFATADSGIIVLSACGVLEFSFEDQTYQNGLFTHALIEALKGKAAASDGTVTLAAVEKYIAARVAQMQAQNPCFDMDGRKVEQSPSCTLPTAAQNQIALAGGSATTPAGSPLVASDRTRIQPNDR
jgi:uncharacterized caspase-like protein